MPRQLVSWIALALLALSAPACSLLAPRLSPSWKPGQTPVCTDQSGAAIVDSAAAAAIAGAGIYAFSGGRQSSELSGPFTLLGAVAIAAAVPVMLVAAHGYRSAARCRRAKEIHRRWERADASRRSELAWAELEPARSGIGYAELTVQRGAPLDQSEGYDPEGTQAWRVQIDGGYLRRWSGPWQLGAGLRVTGAVDPQANAVFWWRYAPEPGWYAEALASAGVIIAKPKSFDRDPSIGGGVQAGVGRFFLRAEAQWLRHDAVSPYPRGDADWRVFVGLGLSFLPGL